MVERLFILVFACLLRCIVYEAKQDGLSNKILRWLLFHRDLCVSHGNGRCFVDAIIYISAMSNKYDFDEYDDESPSPSKEKKELSNHLSDINSKKFMSGTLFPGFFTDNINEREDMYVETPTKSSKAQTLQKANFPKPEQQRQNKVKRQSMKLQPLKQKEKVEVFANVLKKTEQYQEIEEIHLGNKRQEKMTVSQRHEQVEGTRKKKRRNISKKSQSCQQQDNELPRIEPSEEIVASLNRQSEGPFAQQERFTEQVQEMSSQNLLAIPPRNEQRPSSHQVDEVTQVPHRNDQQSPSRQSVGSNYFHFHQNGIFCKQLFEPVQQNQILSMQIIRDKEWLNNFWPEFHLHIKADSHYVISAKKKSVKPVSTFVLSSNRTLFDEDTLFYLGKMKSTLAGNVFNIFGPGLSPSNAQQKNQTPREMLCTIVYGSLGMFEMGKPRQFMVYLKKPEYKYYEDFSQVRRYEEQIPLSRLYQNEQNKEKILVLNSRRPVWQEQIKGYMLNFKGKVDLPSVKNFILEQSPTGPQLIIFGKISENKFNLDVSYPFSPYVGFALALSSFDRE